MVKYNELFENLVLQVKGITESEAVHKYTHGLKPHIRTQVRLGNYTSLE